MSLLHLPPEILRTIFDLIGPLFFHEDLARLTICKHWFEFAHLTYFKGVALVQDTLGPFLSSDNMQRLKRFESSLEIIHLTLRTYIPPETTPPPDEFVLLEPNPEDSPQQWKDTFDDDLIKLATLMQQACRLRVLQIKAYDIPSGDLLKRPDEFMSLHSIQPALSVEHLDVLVLDVPGAVFDPGWDEWDGLHICPVIGALLHTLQVLHLRVRNICPDALTPRDPKTTLRLREVIVNLSMRMELSKPIPATHSNLCGSQDYDPIFTQAVMQEQAEALACQLSSPKVVRILTHIHVGFETQSLDVLTGKNMTIGDYSEWDEDGKTVYDYRSSESEF
jgi:hypothetical protein